MKIGFIGNFAAEFSTENYHLKTFMQLGHNVIKFQESDTSVQEIKSHGFDMLYWTHTHGWRIGQDREVAEMLDYYKRIGIPTVGYHLDLWLGLERERDLKLDPYWGIQYFFTCDKLMADWLNNYTRTIGTYLPAGVYGGECYQGTPNHSYYPHEVIFTGSKGYHKEYPFRGEMIDFLHHNYKERFAHYGGGGLQSIRGPELNNLYASSKIVVGDTLCKNFDYPYYFSDRLFEVCGRGGFMIFPDIKGVKEMYPDIPTYKPGDLNDLKEKIDYYLANDTEREEIRESIFSTTIERHTYRHRLDYILETLWPSR